MSSHEPSLSSLTPPTLTPPNPCSPISDLSHGLSLRASISLSVSDPASVPTAFPVFESQRERAACDLEILPPEGSLTIRHFSTLSPWQPDLLIKRY